jgi:uncharacterized protein YjiS (DUF1127 family)
MTTHRHSMVIPWIWTVRRSRWARCLETLRTWQHRHRERRQLRCLLQMDERLLQDIGLCRTYVAWKASRPFWRPLASATQHPQVSRSDGETRDHSASVMPVPWEPGW